MKKYQRHKNPLKGDDKHIYPCTMCMGEGFIIVARLVKDCPNCEGRGNFSKGDHLR